MASRFIISAWRACIKASYRKPMMHFTNRYGTLRGIAQDTILWRRISVERGDLVLALEQVEQSLLTNTMNLKARALKVAIAAPYGRAVEDAQAVIAETLP